MRQLRGATKGIFFLLLWAGFLCGAAQGDVKVSLTGPPEWLAAAMRESVIAVMNEMPDYEVSRQERLLRMVSERIFEGYEIKRVNITGEREVFMDFVSKAKPKWKVAISVPRLRQPCDGWFLKDISGVDEEVLNMLKGVPVEALKWADEVFLREVKGVVSSRLPGWEPHVLVSREGDFHVVNISFTATQDLILTFDAHIFSRSLPSFWQYDMREKMAESLSFFVGIPVSWAAKHERDIELIVEEKLKDMPFADTAKIEVDTKFMPSRIARVETNVESKRYAFYVWGAAYGGTEDKSTELGLHFGRKAQPFPSWDVELYGEAILFLDDGDSEERLGLRWSPYRDIWVGTERELEEDKTWYRLWIEGGIKAFYAWWRYSEDSENNAALGYRFTEHLSLEIYLDERDDDEISVRAVGNF